MVIIVVIIIIIVIVMVIVVIIIVVVMVIIVVVVIIIVVVMVVIIIIIIIIIVIIVIITVPGTHMYIRSLVHTPGLFLSKPFQGSNTDARGGGEGLVGVVEEDGGDALVVVLL